MTHPPAGPVTPTPPPGPKYGTTLLMPNTSPNPHGPQPPPDPTNPKPTGPHGYRTQPTNDPDPVTNPQLPRPKWAVACLIAAAVLAFGALLLWDIVTVPWAVVGGR